MVIMEIAVQMFPDLDPVWKTTKFFADLAK